MKKLIAIQFIVLVITTLVGIYYHSFLPITCYFSLMLFVKIVENSNSKYLRPFKKLLWKLNKPRIIKIMEDNLSPLILYPMLIWIEFEGEETYLNNKLKDFFKILTTKPIDIGKSILEGYKKGEVVPDGYDKVELTKEESDFIDKIMKENT